MKEVLNKLKKIRINDIIKAFFILAFVIICVLVFINDYAIQYFLNGFNKVDACAFQVYYLDVGQASASVIILPNDEAIIIDTGSQDSSDDFMTSVKQILGRNNIKEIDCLLLTHSDEDHIGGATILLKEYQVNNILRPKLLSNNDTEKENFSQYKTVDTEIYDEVIASIYNEPDCNVDFVEDKVISGEENLSIEIFAGDKDTYSETNAYSPFMLFEFKGFTFLFTGDATAEREIEFIEYLNSQNREINVDFLAVAHHGSKYNTTEKFLKAINPKYAFVSAGKENYPTAEVVQRLEDNLVQEIYCTRSSGMIAVGVSIADNFIIIEMTKHIDLPFIVVIFACVFFAFYKLLCVILIRKKDYKKNF